MTPEKILSLPYRPCVGVMLINQDHQVFVGQRIDNDVAAWQMPQGGIDPGENPQQAALRELCEETGVASELVTVKAESEGWVTYDLPHHIVPKIWKGRYRGQKQRWFLMQFHGFDTQINIETKHPEFSEWTWLDPGRLVENIVPFKREVYSRVVKEFGPHLE